MTAGFRGRVSTRTSENPARTSGAALSRPLAAERLVARPWTARLVGHGDQATGAQQPAERLNARVDVIPEQGRVDGQDRSRSPGPSPSVEDQHHPGLFSAPSPAGDLCGGGCQHELEVA
jgi:hypothetical protein